MPAMLLARCMVIQSFDTCWHALAGTIRTGTRQAGSSSRQLRRRTSGCRLVQLVARGPKHGVCCSC